MTELRPWEGFDSLVDGLARLQARAREAAVISVDEILALRNWLIGAWIVANEQEGTDRARYGKGLIDALAAAFKTRGVPGFSGRNLRNYRQIALIWPQLATGRTLLGEAGASGSIWQTLSAESLPALATDSPLPSDFRQPLSGESAPALTTGSAPFSINPEPEARYATNRLGFTPQLRFLLHSVKLLDEIAPCFQVAVWSLGQKLTRMA